MANTFTQLYVHAVFAVKYREQLILPSFETRLHKYMTGIVTNLGQKMLAINGMPDHVHIFMGFKPTANIADIIGKVKSNSSGFINENKLLHGYFQWQEGYGAFTYAHAQRYQVINYILNQKEHHRKKSFKEEYLELLNEFEVEYDKRYLFDWIDYDENLIGQ